MLSGTGTEGSEAEFGSKRRRLDPKPKVQGHLDDRFEMGLPIRTNKPKCFAQQDSSSEEVKTLLKRMAHLDQLPAVIHKFSALKQINQENLPQDAAVAIPWRLDLSLKSTEASELFQHLQKLARCGVTQLILLRERQANLQ